MPRLNSTTKITTLEELFGAYPQADFVIHSPLTKRPKKRKWYSTDISYSVQVDYQLENQAKSFDFYIGEMDLAYAYEEHTIEDIIVEAILFQIRKATGLVEIYQEEIMLPTGQQQPSH